MKLIHNVVDISYELRNKKVLYYRYEDNFYKVERLDIQVPEPIIPNPELIIPNKVYKTEEAARALRVDRSVVYKAYKSGELAGKEMGRGLKFLGSELLSYATKITATNS